MLHSLQDEKPAGYREIEHTADWQLEVWGPDMPALMEQAARGMYELAGVCLQPGKRRQRKIRVARRDPEEQIVSFLSELLYLYENDGLVFDRFKIVMDDDQLEARVSGAPCSHIDKEIKAVTYHNLNVRSSARGLETMIVFDV
jgi:SHS2 domain-containing protein